MSQVDYPAAFEPIKPTWKPGRAALKSDGTEKRAVVFKSASVFCGEYVPLSYTVEPIIRSSALYCLTAPTGAGKTAFMVITALAIATGRADILGREVVRGRVAYLACENPDDIR
ncbi:MAG: AAA family ATPase, partial [Roseiarcus sp.]